MPKAKLLTLTLARRDRASILRRLNNVRAIVAGRKISPYDYTMQDVVYFEGKLAKADERIARLIAASEATA
jgi:hypothetical protein